MTTLIDASLNKEAVKLFNKAMTKLTKIGALKFTLHVGDATPQDIILAATYNGVTLEFKIPATIKSAGKCTGVVSVVSALTKGRKELRLRQVNEKELECIEIGKGRAYKGTASLTHYALVEFPHMENQLSLNVWQDIVKYISKISIHDLYTNHDLLVGIRCKDNEFEITCHDKFHFAYTKTNLAKNTPDFECVLPLSILDELQGLAKDKDFLAMFLMDDRVGAETDNTRVLFPTMQNLTYAFEVVKFIETSSNMPFLAKFTLPKNVLGEIIVNMSAIYEEGASMTISGGSQGLKFYMDGSMGKIAELFKMSVNEFMVQCDPRLLNDILACTKQQDTQWTIYSDYVFIQTDSTLYSMVLVG